MDELQKAREEINAVDTEMAALFVRRMEAARAVAAFKQAHGMPILDAAREEEVIRRNAMRVESDELRAYYVNFLQSNMEISRRYQRQLTTGMRVAYSGTAGAFAYIAAEQLFPDAEKCAFADFKAAYDAVADGDCDTAVLPLENSYAGEVGQVTDLLFSGSLYLNGAVQLSISQALLGVKGATADGITTVVSHPQALAQCDSYIKQHHLQQMSYENTALAAQYVAQKNDPAVAAIASEESAARYGLEILEKSVNESQVNTTRFAILSRAENRHICETPGAHFVLMFTVRNEAGSLARALNIIGAHGFNMRTLRSRPMKALLWEYYFYVEAEGNIRGHEGSCMLEELAVCCDKLKIAGSFT